MVKNKEIKMYPHFPFDVLKIILDYDGRIKYSHREKIYVNIIHKYDWRYCVIQPNRELHARVANALSSYNQEKYHVTIYYKGGGIGCGYGLMFCRRRF